MDENKSTAQTSTDADVSGAVGSNAVADNTTSNATSENASEVDFSDNSSANNGSNTDNSKGMAAEGEKSAPKGEKNSEYARRRREAEQAKAIKEAEEKAIIRALGGINPFTEEEMKDSHDVAEFLEMQEIKKNGGDPLSDFAKHRKERERKEAEERKKQEDERVWYQNDKAEFVNAYPDVSINELIEDKTFQSFAEGKVGTVPLKTIYEKFLSFTAEYDRKAKEKAARLAANAKASPGALSSAGESGEKFFTRDEVMLMSDKQINENYELIRKSMKKWK